MRRPIIVATLVLGAILTIAPAAGAFSPAFHHSGVRVMSQVATPRHHRVCPIDWRRGPHYVHRLIVCAANHWQVPGGSTKALYIAWRESRFNPSAYNPSGAEGVYQHMRSYWPTRAAAFGFPGWSAFNGRANIIVTMKMVHRMGNWSPWGG